MPGAVDRLFCIVTFHNCVGDGGLGKALIRPSPWYVGSLWKREPISTLTLQGTFSSRGS